MTAIRIMLQMKGDFLLTMDRAIHQEMAVEGEVKEKDGVVVAAIIIIL